jgi:hypothetical protein
MATVRAVEWGMVGIDGNQTIAAVASATEKNQPETDLVRNTAYPIPELDRAVAAPGQLDTWSNTAEVDGKRGILHKNWMDRYLGQNWTDRYSGQKLDGQVFRPELDGQAFREEFPSTASPATVPGNIWVPVQVWVPDVIWVQRDPEAPVSPGTNAASGAGQFGNPHNGW